MLSGIPALVITGGWNAEYERIAASLAEAGVDHRVIPTRDHRPQDDPAFAGLVQRFLRSLQ
ncbi:hypothetical protein [Microbacterium aurum]